MSPTNDSVELDSFLVGSSLRSSDSKPRKPHPTRTAHKRDYAIGIGFILIVTLLWTLGSFVTQVSVVLLVPSGSTYSVIIGPI